MSLQVAVEGTGMRITKLISSLRNTTSNYGGIYTTRGMHTDQHTDHICTCFYQLGGGYES